MTDQPRIGPLGAHRFGTALACDGYVHRMAPTSWLLDSDPALRWQVERDLVAEPPAVWEATRARIASEGFGARLLDLQDADGQWQAVPSSPRLRL
jgi:hypothetical protein